MARGSIDPEGLRLLILEEYYLLEKKKILLTMHPESGSEAEDIDTPALAGSSEPENRRLLLLEEYFLLEKKKLLESLPTPRRWWVRPLWENRKEASEFYTAVSSNFSCAFSRICCLLSGAIIALCRCHS